MPYHCVVKSCWPSLGRRLLRFPKDRCQQETWLEALKVPEYLQLTAEELRYRKRVCERHFRLTDLIPANYPGSSNHALRPGSVPVFPIARAVEPEVATVPESIVVALSDVGYLPGSSKQVHQLPSLNKSQVRPAVQPLPGSNKQALQPTSLNIPKVRPDGGSLHSKRKQTLQLTSLNIPEVPFDVVSLRGSSKQDQQPISFKIVVRRPIDRPLPDSSKQVLQPASIKILKVLTARSLPGSSKQTLLPESLYIPEVNPDVPLPGSSKHILQPDSLYTPKVKPELIPLEECADEEFLPKVNRKRSASTQDLQLVAKKRRLLINDNRGAVVKHKCKFLRRTKLIKDFKETFSQVRRGWTFYNLLIKKYGLFRLNNVGKRYLQSLARFGARKTRDWCNDGDEKAMCLAIFNQNPRGYRFLQKMLPLPSPKTLRLTLGQIPLWPGVNNIIFENVKEKAAKLSKRDKICSLIFDHMSLKAGLTYMSKFGIVTGVEDFGGDNGSGRFANNVLMFMLRGIRFNWILPIAFYFCGGTAKTSQLIHCIKEVLQAVCETGLTVQATICDDAKSNVAAINTLIGESRATFTHNGREFNSVGFFYKDWEIIHIYDPSHLIKSLRNNLLTKDMTFTLDGELYTASWTMFSKSLGPHNYSTVHASLTDSHTIANQIPKLKTQHAKQVFSYAVGVSLIGYYDVERITDPVFAPATATGYICIFFDKLFDSVNGRKQRTYKHWKPLTRPLQTGSPHWDYWREAQDILRTMKFVYAQGRVTNHPACITNWLSNLRGYQALWNILKDKGFPYISLNYINQDPLENFFGHIRSHVSCYTKPTCSQFIGSFKTIMVNRTSLSRQNHFHSKADGGKMLILLNDYIDNSQNYPIQETETPKIITMAYLEVTRPHLKAIMLKSVEDFVARSLEQIVHCSACKAKLIDSETDPTRFTFIRGSQLNQSALTRPTAAISVAFTRVCNVVWSMIPDIFHFREMRAMIIDYINLNLDLSFLDCSIHSLSNIFVSQIVNCLLFKWVESKNRKSCPRDFTVGSDMDHVQRTDLTKFIKKRHY